MTQISVKKILCFVLAIAMAAALAGCSKTEEESTTESTAPATTEEQSVTQASTTVPVTEAPTTQPETTTAPPETTTAAPKDGESIQNIIDTLESKHFYMAGQVNLAGGQTMNAKATCEGDNYRMEMDSSQMKMSMIYLDSTPYIVNNSTNMYVVFDQAAIDSLDQVLTGLSSFGVTMNSQDISDMKNMMSNFDDSMDYSKYIEGGEYSEYTAKMNDEDYLCSSYKTQYGTIRIYTQDGNLKIIDVYDTNGARQMNFIVSAFIPEVLTPISLNGLTKATSLVNLFSNVSR